MISYDVLLRSNMFTFLSRMLLNVFNKLILLWLYYWYVLLSNKIATKK